MRLRSGLCSTLPSTSMECPICCDMVDEASLWSCGHDGCEQRACAHCLARHAADMGRPTCPNGNHPITFRADCQARRPVLEAVARAALKTKRHGLGLAKALVPVERDLSACKARMRRLREELTATRKELRDAKRRKRDIKGGELRVCPDPVCAGVLVQPRAANNDIDRDAPTPACSMCAARRCPACGQRVDDDATPHACGEDLVLSNAAIRRTCVVCPGCHVPIFRDGGCEHMFCVRCYTSFDWATGVTRTGSAGNPHYDVHVLTRRNEHAWRATSRVIGSARLTFCKKVTPAQKDAVRRAFDMCAAEGFEARSRATHRSEDTKMRRLFGRVARGRMSSAQMEEAYVRWYDAHIAEKETAAAIGGIVEAVRACAAEGAAGFARPACRYAVSKRHADLIAERVQTYDGWRATKLTDHGS